MSVYRHILVAIDFGPDNIQVIERATALAQSDGAQLSLLHVVEFLHMDLANELVLPQDVELETQLVTTARKKVAEIALGIHLKEPVSQWVEMGSTKQEILRTAEEKAVDLIVIGSHGRHGLGRLLGSTANAILQGARCDVLSVRIRGPEK